MAEDHEYVVIGGGIAGSTCAVNLLRLSPSSKVTLVSPSSAVKTLQDLEQITPLVGMVHVQDRSLDEFAREHPEVVAICDEVESVDALRGEVTLASGGVLHFSRCCVATGATPALAYSHPRVIGIRDTESVEGLHKRLVDAKVVLVVGNGGIALELVYSLVSKQACQVVWAVRHPYVGNTFFDASASAFFLQNVMKETGPRSRSTTRLDHTAAAGKSGSVGPDWIKAFERLATQESKPNTEGSSQPHLDIQFECELGEVRDGDTWPVSALLTNGVPVDCDFVVSATGVVPTTSILPPEFERGHDGGLCVDGTMRVVRSATGGGRRAESNIFAAGDCCCLEWPKRESDHWFQLRLWRQARAAGLYAAQCMADSVDELGPGGAFDLFVHATQFFGFQVTLLGRYNGQGLGASIQDVVTRHAVDVLNSDSTPPQCHHESIHIKTGSSNMQVLIRTTPGSEYIKVIVVDGRVRGAMLIGDTGLDETFENLILSGTNVSHVGDDLLSRDVDIEGLFD